MSPEVAAYYDANTASFTKSGQGGTALRRAIWAPGVDSRARAFHVVDERVLARVLERPVPRRVVDLGCGVGASLLWLRQRAELEGFGVTVSEVQATVANASFKNKVTEGLHCVHASFTELPSAIVDVDVAFAIESFVLSPSVEAFVAPIAHRLKPGGELLVCDDFLGPEHARWPAVLKDFQWGWVAPSLVLPSTLVTIAGQHGLQCVEEIDFTEHLELGRPRDVLLDVVVTVGRPFRPRSWLFRSWVGGTALQRGLRRRAIEHRLLRFIKR